ncbi:hypothetical protein GT022_14940 [Agaribacter marinus]|uniref:Uncharacterized protein n=1 Tax=Virgibacillus salarius TaxID=447199 RepID=A0A941DVA6_9BACI|nr:hypothetical protein [Virgibacillus salarius]MBR7797335.1 hypothetical protein [Virgibacillus salarius]NAZ10045.1 hypothetical protein [Agaribacter marinus]
MIFILLVIILYSVPFIWVLWSFINVKNNKREKVKWKYPILLFLLLILLSIIGNVYLSSTYTIPFLQTSMESMIWLIVAAVFLGIIALINVFVTLSLRNKNVSKQFHNPRVIWKLIGGMALFLGFLFIWFMPFGQKLSYVMALEQAMNATENANGSEEITLSLVKSESNCLTKRNCSNEQFHNVIYVKNNMDEPKEIQIKIRALDKDQQELKVIDSKIMEVGANELQMVKTEETNQQSSIWNQYSFQTDDRMYYFQHHFAIGK